MNPGLYDPHAQELAYHPLHLIQAHPVSCPVIELGRPGALRFQSSQTFAASLYQKPPDTVGEIAGLAESSTHVGKSARIVASIRTEIGSLPFLAQP